MDISTLYCTASVGQTRFASASNVLHFRRLPPRIHAARRRFRAEPVLVSRQGGSTYAVLEVHRPDTPQIYPFISTICIDCLGKAVMALAPETYAPARSWPLDVWRHGLAFQSGTTDARPNSSVCLGC